MPVGAKHVKSRYTMNEESSFKPGGQATKGRERRSPQGGISDDDVLVGPRERLGEVIQGGGGEVELLRGLRLSRAVSAGGRGGR